MRIRKTNQKDRGVYKYTTTELTKDDRYVEKTAILKPGENGVTEEMITLLHVYDDEEVDADCRENYHAPVRFESYSDDEGLELESRNSYLADSPSDPFEKLMDAI